MKPVTLSADEVRAAVPMAAAVTALRIGAVSGVATDLLAPPDADHLAVIGAGGQAADQVRAVRPLRRLTVMDRSGTRGDAMLESLAPELDGVEVAVVRDGRTAVADAEIVSCATSATEPVLDAFWLRPRVHGNAIGSFRTTMRELPDGLLAEATIVVDDLEAILEEFGEILHALDTGAITRSDLTPLGVALLERPSGGTGPSSRASAWPPSTGRSPAAGRAGGLLGTSRERCFRRWSPRRTPGCSSPRRA